MLRHLLRARTPLRRSGAAMCVGISCIVLVACGRDGEGAATRGPPPEGEARGSAASFSSDLPPEVVQACHDLTAPNAIARGLHRRAYEGATVYVDGHSEDARGLYLRGAAAALIAEERVATGDFETALELGLPGRQGALARAMLAGLEQSAAATNVTDAVSSVMVPLGNLLEDLERNLCPGPVASDPMVPLRSASQVPGDWNVLPQGDSIAEIRSCTFSEPWLSAVATRGKSGTFTCVVDDRISADTFEMQGVWRLVKSRLSLEVSGNADVYRAQISESGDRLRLVEVEDGDVLVMEHP